MGHSRFLLLLLLSSLFLSFHYGFCGVALIENDEVEIIPLPANIPIHTIVKYAVEDYSEPQPNTNPKNGYILSPPSTPAPTHPPSP